MPRVIVPVTDITPPKSALTTSLSGANNDLTFTAQDAGPGGNDIRVRYVVAGNNTVASLVVEGKDITYNSATDGSGNPTSLASAVITAIQASPDASALVTVANAASNTGAGTIAALSFTNLAGGAWQQTPPSQVNGDATNDHYFTGNDGQTFLEVVSSSGSSQTVTIYYAPRALVGASVAAAVETVAAGATRLIGPFSPSKFNQNQAKDVYFDPSVATDLKFRAYRIVRAT